MLAKGFKRHWKSTLRLSGPLILGQLGQVLVMVADSIMVGQLGTIQLAAVSFGVAIFGVYYVLGLGLSFAMPPIVAECHGSGNDKELSSCIVNSTLINTLYAIIILVVTELSLPVLFMFGQEEVVVSAAIPYIRLSVYSMLPFMVFQSFRSWSDGIGNTKIAMVAIIIGNSANIVLNYIFIFGKLGFPEMGVTGAALSSLVSRIIMLLVWFLVIRNKESFTSTLKSLTLEKVDKTMLIRLLGLGFIMALQMFFEVLMFTASTLMMGVLGEVQQAAHQIALNIITITFMVTTGFSVAATIRVGHYLGKKEIAELKPAGNTSIILSGIFMFCSGIFMILFRDFLPSLYIQEIDVIQYASSMLIFAAIFQIPDGIQISSIGALRGLQDVKIPTLLTFISYGVFGIPIALLLCFTFDLGFKGVWIGLIVGLLINAVVTTIRFNQQSAKRISSQFF